LTDEWLMFDDDNVTPITSEDVLKLSGGGKISLSSLCVSVSLII